MWCVCGSVAVLFGVLVDSQWWSSGGSVSMASSFWAVLKVILNNFIAADCSCSPDSEMYFFIAAFPFLPKLSLIALKMSLRSFTGVVGRRGGRIILPSFS